MSYIKIITQLVQEGRGNETAEVMRAGMEDIGREVVELANRHPNDWPIVIACMRKIADNMENSLPAGSRTLLTLLNEAYGVNNEVVTTTINREELRRQMEEEKQ